MPNECELALERLSVAAKGRDELQPYIAAAVRAGATTEQIASVLRRVLGSAAPVHLIGADVG